MDYFDQNVLDELANEDILLSTAEQAAYIAVCEGIKKEKKAVKTKKQRESLRRYSLWHIPQADKSAPWEHWLILPGKSNWETKHNAIVSKLAVNIVTGKKSFLKIRRPSPDIYDHGHVKSSMKEAINHQQLGMLGLHCHRNTLHGYKAYLFQHYNGKFNLLDMLDNPKTPSRQMVALIIAAGEALVKIHVSGYIHCDFKLQNVVYNKADQTVSIVDLEYMLSLAEGEAGLRDMRGTRAFCHPCWLFDSAVNVRNGKRVKYSIQNDIYAFLCSAHMVLQEICLRDETPEYKKCLINTRDQLEKWMLQPLDKLPPLGGILVFLHQQLENKPERTLVEQLKKMRM